MKTKGFFTDNKTGVNDVARFTCYVVTKGETSITISQ